MAEFFDHEKLRVYQMTIEFIVWVDELLEGIHRNISVKDQLDRASTSIALNIAEGNGKYSTKDRSRYIDIARGSAVECAACLDVLVARRAVRPETIKPGKEKLLAIVSMLMGLLSSLANRVQEEPAEYIILPSEE